MKIIAGKFKGRNLAYKERRGLRVTSQKVKEAMFGIIGNRVKDALVLDLFCGYGSLGIEAISRGAKKVTFVDIDGHALKQLKYFLDKLGIIENSELIKRDTIKAIKHVSKESIDIIVMDPPYHIGGEVKVMKSIVKFDLLKNGGICIIEHYSENELPDKIETLTKKKVKVYGDTSLSIYFNEKETESNTIEE